VGGVPDRTRRVGIIAAVLITALGVMVAVSLPTAGPRPSIEPDPSSVRPSEPADDLTIQGFRDFSVLPGEPPERIGLSHQSRLWSIEGRWWGALVDPRSRETRIFELSPDRSTWRDTGVLIDERAGAVADALWADGHLYVATIVPGRSTANGPRVSRFSRGQDGTFTLDPDFPVRIADGGLRGVSLARDSAGRLWAAFVREGEVLVAHSTVDEAVWGAPERLPSQLAAGGVDDVAALVATDGGRLGIVWTDGPEKAVRFADRADSDPPERWSAAEAALEELPLSDNAVSVAAAPGARVAIAVETTVDQTAAGAEAGQTLVLVRDADGAWRRTILSRVEDHLGPPTVVVDGRSGNLHVFSPSPRRGGAIYLKSSDDERLEFPAGLGTPVISDPSTPKVAVPTSTKQPVDLDAGLVLLGFDAETGTYWHAVIGSNGSNGGPSPSAGVSPSTGASPSVGVSPSPSASAGAVLVPATFIHDTFDPWPAGEPIGNGWRMRDGEPPEALTAVQDAGGPGRHARLLTPGNAGVRACKSFSAVTAGTLVVEARVQLDAIGATDAVITSLRDQSGESASVRYGQGGTFAYYAGATKVRSTVIIRPKTWYRSVVTIRPARGTYDWLLANEAGKVLLRVERVPFRDKAATAVSSVCFQTSDGKAGLGLRFDDVVVSR
jgi:hypothetical protein